MFYMSLILLRSGPILAICMYFRSRIYNTYLKLMTIPSYPHMVANGLDYFAFVLFL